MTPSLKIASSRGAGCPNRLVGEQESHEIGNDHLFPFPLIDAMGRWAPKRGHRRAAGRGPTRESAVRGAVLVSALPTEVWVRKGRHVITGHLDRRRHRLGHERA
jgi:hypothetical protein